MLSTMQQLPAYNYYFPLLRRYACRIIKDAAAAAVLANEVLQEQYAERGLHMDRYNRQLLKEIIRLRCIYWQQSKVFDRPVVKVEDVFINKHNK